MSESKGSMNGSVDGTKQRSLDQRTITDDNHNNAVDIGVNSGHTRRNNSSDADAYSDRNQGDVTISEDKESRYRDSKRKQDRRRNRHRTDTKHRDSKKSSKKRRRDDSSSESSFNSDEDSSESDSEDDRRRRRKRHDKDKKKKKHEGKKHKRREDRSNDRKHKDKKHKKERREDRTLSEQSTSAVPTFGQYGIIKSSDMLKMQRSFEIWLSEVHGVHISSSNIPRYELQQYFDTYREDYNTATLPHIKYYNYDKWELEEHEKQKHEMELLGKSSSAIINDERNHALEMQRIAKQKEEAALQLVAATMNTTKVKEMQHQKQLQTQMQMAFKMGDHETYRKIKEKLQPEDK